MRSDKEYLLALNKDFTQEVLAHGDLWKTPWDSEYETPDNEKWLWYHFAVNLPHEDLKIRLRWLAPIQIYFEGEWRYDYDIDPTSVSDKIKSVIHYIGSVVSFNILGEQLLALTEKVPSLDMLLIKRLELLKSMYIGWRPGIDPDCTFRLAPDCWPLLGTDKVGLPVLIPEELRTDGLKQPSVGVVVLHKDAPARVYTPGESPMWQAVLNWCSLLYGCWKHEYIPEITKNMKNLPMVEVVERSLAADHSNGPAFLGHINS